MKTIKTLTLSAALAAAFLSAGAFANVSVSKAPVISKTNITVIHKNSQWPKLIRRGLCDIRRCVEA